MPHWAWKPCRKTHWTTTYYHYDLRIRCVHACILAQREYPLPIYRQMHMVSFHGTLGFFFRVFTVLPFRISNFFGLSITDGTWFVKMRVWYIKIGIVWNVHVMCVVFMTTWHGINAVWHVIYINMSGHSRITPFIRSSYWARSGRYRSTGVLSTSKLWYMCTHGSLLVTLSNCIPFRKRFITVQSSTVYFTIDWVKNKNVCW
jgi:hypothetical protein